MDKQTVVEIAKNTGLWDFFECHEQNDGDVRMLFKFAAEIFRFSREDSGETQCTK
jgi:hypothetical protein